MVTLVTEVAGTAVRISFVHILKFSNHFIQQVTAVVMVEAMAAGIVGDTVTMVVMAADGTTMVN